MSRIPISPINQEVIILGSKYIKFRYPNYGSLYECDICGARTIDEGRDTNQMSFYHLISCSNSSTYTPNDIPNNRIFEEMNLSSRNISNIESNSPITIQNSIERIGSILSSITRIMLDTPEIPGSIRLIPDPEPETRNISDIEFDSPITIRRSTERIGSGSIVSSITEMIPYEGENDDEMPPSYTEHDPELPPYEEII
jgi:hypothetical protein